MARNAGTPDDGNWEVVAEESAARVVFDTVGDQFTGVYKGVEEIHPDNDEPFSMFRFQGMDGEPYAINQSYRLREGMAKVNIGDVTRITYVKDIATGKNLNPLKDFRVEVKRA